uniref:Fork-head domain-containing protein n=1 Tax=Acrobeloides nanus TaxID=290746 RepID=A0A914DR93_9BILA
MEAGQVIYSNSTSSTNATVNVNNEESSNLDDIGDEDLTQWFEELRTCKEEGNENEKPIYSYATLIAMAIRDSPQKRLTLAQIYKYIESRFPYYRNSNRKEGWQNSIRHNLSLDICFEMLSKDGKYGRNDRKRNYWTLAVDYDTIFKNGNFRRRRLTQLTKMKHSSSTTERLETNENITNSGSYEAEIQTSQSPNTMNDLTLNKGIKCENCIEIQQELNELRSENEKLEREREIAYEHSEAIAKTLENSLEEIRKLKEENERLKASMWSQSVRDPSHNKKKRLYNVPMTVVNVDNGYIQKNQYLNDSNII